MPPGMMPPGMPPEGIPPMGGPEGMPPPPMPEMPMEMEMPPAPAPSPSKGDDLKKRVLQKLMDNLLGKSGRSFNEVVNGIKAALTAYKSYAKEVDLLNGVTTDEGATAAPSNASSGGSSSDIQKILQGIQQKKAPADGAGGPGMYQPPTIVPPSPQPIPNNQDSFIAGNPNRSNFNRPAPVNSLGMWGY